MGTDRTAPRGYTILASPRTGSGYLCTLLQSTGVLGKPWEWLNDRNIAAVLRPGERVASMSGLIDQAASPNGIFAIKLMPWHSDSPAATPAIAELLRQPLVLIRRRDLLGQALSRVRAGQTGEWSTRFEPGPAPYYDGAAILAALKNCASDLATWETYLAKTGRTALKLTYEDLVSNPRPALIGIAALVGVELGDFAPTSDYRMQRDDLTEEWRARFLAEHGDSTTIDPVRHSDKWNRLGEWIVPALKRARGRLR